MRRRGLAPSAITYSSVINACAKGGQWELALELLREMRQRRDLAPNAITYNAAIDACTSGGEWQRALSLFDEMVARGPAGSKSSWRRRG